ncbi:MAG: histidine--tRNA ligase [Myxococcales bacterium]|jgi:histidyl-tRNA synthetase|nr:histidine--tRNA ligase [Myxococcales bacterium]
MADKITAVKGMNDLLPDVTAQWRTIEESARDTLTHFGFGEVRTPVLEKTALFVRGVGEATDIVGKEMYTFEDGKAEGRAGTLVSLRPEGTAPAVRAAIEHNQLAQGALVRWFYLGPMFRRERQQRGRYRQFFQVGAEIYGAATPQADAELIDAAHAFLSRLDLGELTLEINSLGDANCRPRYVEALIAALKSHAADLCAECQRRLETNPLRVLDCKSAQCQAVTQSVPTIDGFLCEPCRDHFDRVRSLLDALAIPYVVNPRIVRGLDYYTRTVFEFVSRETGEGALGSQSTVCAGGRYDCLIESLGGPATPAVGFAAGLDRLALLAARNAKPAPGPDLFIVPMGESAIAQALQLAAALRRQGIWVDQDLRGGGLKSQMRRADKVGARFVLVLGDSELASGKASLKQMATGEARDVALDPEAIAAAM